MKCLSYKKFFEVFANDTRMRIIEALSEKDMCVTDIAEEVKEEQSKISHALKVLLKCNFVTKMQDGKKRVYSLNEKTIRPLLRNVEAHVKTYCCNERCWVKK